MNSIRIHHYGFLAPFEEAAISEFDERMEKIKKYEKCLDSPDLPQIAKAILMGRSIENVSKDGIKGLPYGIKGLPYWKKFQIYRGHHFKQFLRDLDKYHKLVLQAIEETPLRKNCAEFDRTSREKRLLLLDIEIEIYNSWAKLIEETRIELVSNLSDFEKCIFKICAFFLGWYTSEFSLPPLSMKPFEVQSSVSHLENLPSESQLLMKPSKALSSVNHFENLHHEIYERIFKYLPPEDLWRLSRTSHKMLNAALEFDSSLGFSELTRERYGLSNIPKNIICQLGLRTYSTLAISKKVQQYALANSSSHFLSFDTNDNPELKNVEHCTKDFSLWEKVRFYNGNHFQKLFDKVKKLVNEKTKEARKLVKDNKTITNQFSLEEIRDQIVRLNILKEEILALLHGLDHSQQAFRKFKNSLTPNEQSLMDISSHLLKFNWLNGPTQGYLSDLKAMKIERKWTAVESQFLYEQKTPFPITVQFELPTDIIPAITGQPSVSFSSLSKKMKISIFAKENLEPHFIVNDEIGSFSISRTWFFGPRNRNSDIGFFESKFESKNDSTIVSKRSLYLDEIVINPFLKEKDSSSDFPFLRLVIRIAMEIFLREEAAVLFLDEPESDSVVFKEMQATVFKEMQAAVFESLGFKENQSDGTCVYVICNALHPDIKYAEIAERDSDSSKEIEEEITVDWKKIIRSNPILPKGNGSFIPEFKDYRRYEKYVYPSPPPQQKKDILQYKMLEKALTRL